MDPPIIRIAGLVSFILLVASLFICLRLNPGLVNTRIDDDVGPSVQGDCRDVVGIDLGTSYFSVTVFINNEVTIIPNEHGKLTTPSYVAFNKLGEPIVGDDAKAYLTIDPQSVVFDVMRFLGRKYTDTFSQNQKKFYPFNITESEDGGLNFEVKVMGKRETYTAEEILALIFKKMKDLSESYLEREVDCAVVSVPAVFLQAQRQAVKDAAFIAGIRVVRVPNTPSISATGYVKSLSSLSETNILVYYLGAGVCEVSLMTVSPTVVQVSATNGTRNIGSVNFVHAVMQHYLVKIKGKEIRKNDITVQKLRQEVERAMLEFYVGGQMNTTISIKLENGTVIIKDLLSRTTFGKICQPVIDMTMKHIRRMLTEAKELNLKVKDIVLLGGGTRVAGVKDVIKSVFTEMNVIYGESVAGEAKVHALGLHSALLQHQIKSPILLDVSTYAIGIFLKNSNDIVIPQFTPLPFQKAATYLTVTDNQEEIDTKFYEGDIPEPGSNVLNYNLRVEGLRKRKAGETRIEVQYELSRDGFLQLYAKEIGKKDTLFIIKPLNILQDSDMARIKRRWQDLMYGWNKHIERDMLATEMNRCVYNVLHFLTQSFKSKIRVTECLLIRMKGEEKWLGRSNDLDPDNFQDRKHSLVEYLKRFPVNFTNDTISKLC